MLPFAAAAAHRISAARATCLVAAARRVSLIAFQVDDQPGPAIRPSAESSQGGSARMSGFRKFLFRGNLIELAVAVVIGVAFNAVIQALIKDLITPLIGAIGGQPNFANLTFVVNKSHFAYGSFINALLSFAIIAAVVYYLLVAPATRLTARLERQKEVTDRECPECLSQIPLAAKRCMYCTAPVQPAPPAMASPDR
jgi:large conductance mechanosensitive channel